MKTILLYMVLILFTIQFTHSQEDGVVSLDIPIRNSLKFNRYLLDPTFSFVREQNTYLSFYNKREWVQFDDAPQTYLASYSGRFRENSGLGVGLFQQNYGVMTTFGGVFNFAYNVTLTRESNLTFGMNLGIYKSGINKGSVITNFSDPSLETIPSNTLLTINPGINYGTTFFDFGLSINNLVLYNLKTSQMVEDDPGQGVQAHIMYTGYLQSRGFFDQAKFSGLVRSEFKKDQTIVSGIAMLTVPKGIWAQAGYSSFYGLSAGMGLNITEQISIEYNYEKGMGNLSNFGSSHEITLAYKFKNNDRFNYGNADEEEALIFSKNRPRGGILKGKAPKKPTASGIEKSKLAAANRAKAQADREVRLNAQADEAAKLKAEEEAKVKADEVAKLKAEETKTRAEEDTRLKLEAEVQAKAQQETRVKAIEVARLKTEEEQRLKLEAEAQSKVETENRLKLEAEVQAKVEEEARVKAEEVARLKAVEDKAEEEVKLKAEAEVQSEPEIVPTDWTTSSMNDLDKLTEEFKRTQQELLNKLEEAVAVKEKDLKDMKEENDLSEQGIVVAPKPFKSLTAENMALESLKLNIDNTIKTQEQKITEFENLFNERFKNVPNPRDSTHVFYQKKIQDLKSEQSQTIQSKERLVSKLEDIKVATEVERKRRIRRAAYDNEQDRYLKDRLTLTQIKANTPLSSVPLQAEDFDFGEEQSGNIQIVKNVKNAESGYYMVIAVHADIEKRDEFLTKAVSAGQQDINFFYDVNSSKYFIYYEKFDGVDTANKALEARGSKPFNGNMSIIKIEN
ncbi:PorP/SprF family type IX secretion system membrane protein [Flavobacteriaceae bacterium LMO-SS05]